jgi:hypothetical protein
MNMARAGILFSFRSVTAAAPGAGETRGKFSSSGGAGRLAATPSRNTVKTAFHVRFGQGASGRSDPGSPM